MTNFPRSQYSPAELRTLADDAHRLGRRADVIALEANPLEDVRAVRGVRAVFRDGLRLA